MSDTVSIKLAHPLTPEDAPVLGIEAKDYGVGEEITLNRSAARSLISAGYAQVDPEDRRAVAQALGGGNAQAASVQAEAPLDGAPGAPEARTVPAAEPGDEVTVGGEPAGEDAEPSQDDVTEGPQPGADEGAPVADVADEGAPVADQGAPKRRTTR